MTARSPLRICLNAGFIREIGTYWTAYFLANELVARGHDVTLVYTSRARMFRSDEFVSDGLRILECPGFLNRPLVGNGLGPMDILRRTRLLSRERFDIVHGFEYFADVTLPVWLTQLFRSYTYVSDWRDWFSKGVGYGRFRRVPGAARFLGWIEDQSRRTAAGVTVGSRELERHVLSMGFPAERVLLLHGGAPTDSIQPRPKDQARLAVGVDSDHLKIVGFLSSTHSVGLDRFVEPIAHLFDEMPELRVLMIGNPDQSFLQAMTKRGWEGRMIVTGWVPADRLSDYMGAADLYILPLNPDLADASRWPLKFGDYLAAGRPVVGSKVGDTWRLLDESHAGLVVDEDRNAILTALRWVLMNETEAELMGKRARQLAEETLAWPHRASQLEEFYYRVLGESSAVRASRS